MSPITRLDAHWFHILLSLVERERHGTAIMEDVLERTEGRVRLWPGKLYGALREMTERGFIAEVGAPDDAPTEGGKRRFYRVTAAGRRALNEDIERLAELVKLARVRVRG